jgi:hypothetical protein
MKRYSYQQQVDRIKIQLNEGVVPAKYDKPKPENSNSDNKLNGTLSINDSSATLNVVGNGFGQASLISPTGAIVLTPGLYGVQINGANPDLTVNGNLSVKKYKNENIINTTINTYNLIISEDISLNGRYLGYCNDQFLRFNY